MNKCLQCNSSISDKAKYCSDKCRMAFTRTNKIVQPEQIQPEHEQKTPNKQPEQITPNKPISYNPKIHDRPLTINEKKGITQYGICHNCKKEVSHLICICRDCTTKGITHKSLHIDIDHC